VDKEGMKPDHWLGSVLCVSFSALTLVDIWPTKTCAVYPQRFCSGMSDGRKPNENRLIRFT